MGLNFNGTNISAINFNNVSLTKLIYNNVEVWSASVPQYEDYLCFTANMAGSKIILASGDWTNIETSTDKNTWTSYTAETTITLANIGDKVYFRGTNNIINARFRMTGIIAASGNVNTLLSYTENILDLSGRNNCFKRLFINCDELTSVPYLPATILSASCYEDMFDNCPNITQTPELPATTLADNCYSYMFSGCTNLVTAPYLPATNIFYDCYSGMFSNCSSLYISDTYEAEAINSWTIPTNGAFTNTTTQYSMFYNCAGTRSTDSPTFLSGSSITYYTQNPPV